MRDFEQEFKKFNLVRSRYNMAETQRTSIKKHTIELGWLLSSTSF